MPDRSRLTSGAASSASYGRARSATSAWKSKLSEAGVISQIATTLTCMTTGSAGWIDTPWGAVEFTHTDRAIEVGTDVWVQDDGTLEATIRTAARDLRRVGRNLGLIDEETLAEAIAEEESPQ